MKRGNHSKSRNSKILVVSLAFVVFVSVAVGGTLAWLYDITDPVANTFVVADLFDNPEEQFTLWENAAEDTDQDGRYELSKEKTNGNKYLILPGVNIPKNPTVTIDGLEANVYLYIVVDDQLAKGLSYEISSNWAKLSDDYPDVWVYQHQVNGVTENVIQASDEAKASLDVAILKDNQIIVPANYSSVSETAGSLTFKAYLAQATGNGTNAAEAWANTFGTTP